MDTKQLCITIFFLAIFNVGCWHTSQGEAPQVLLEQDRIMGTTQDGISAFLGIPYAQPPVGELRWKAPRALPRNKSHNNVFDATHFRAACLQDGGTGLGAQADRSAIASEDCLYLNIWEPVDARNKLPVMVWIHGGGFRVGSGSLPEYNGANLARQGVIVVTINYRLGIFGFFDHPALASESSSGGNFGLLDQLAALRWVQANIAAFDGDPGNVTVFGESAGGASALHLMISPLSQGLFRKVIAQSGALDLPELTTEEMREIGMAAVESVTRKKNISGADLRRLLANQVLQAQPRDRSFTMPYQDEHTLPQGMVTAFQAGAFLKAPLLIGSNNYEAGFFGPAFSQNVDRALGERNWQLVSKLTDTYAAKNISFQKAQVAGDIFATMNTRKVARASSKAGNPTYRYFFTYVPESEKSSSPGAIHGAENEYLFANPKPATKVFTRQDLAVSEELQGIWVQFAKAGKAPWEPYEESADLIFEIGDAPGRHVPEKATARLNFLDSIKLKTHIN